MYSRILVGTDGSETAARAVERAVELAKAVGATVTIASAGLTERAENIVEEAAARHSSKGVPIHTKTLDGDAATALVDEAADGYDLLVVGNKGMVGASRFLVGSVPNKVSHHAPCALLIVHTT
ncbi:MAG TPA: universal stress protein [Acidimicrobiales bacterium]|nr:universal stress protein [Acidimicrobiales bacterium]